MNDRLEDFGRDLVLYCSSVVRSIQTHGPHNDAVNAALERLGQHASRALERLGRLELQAVDEMVLLNGHRLRPPLAQAPYFHQLVQQLSERGLGGFAFDRAPSHELLRAWFGAFAERPDGEEAKARIRAELSRLAAAGLRALEARTLTRIESQDQVRVATMAFALQTYCRAVLGFAEFVRAVREGQSPYANRLGVVRVVQDLIDVAAARPELLPEIIGLAQTRAVRLGQGYHPHHAAHTAIWAILVGCLFRLERTALLDLGTAALLADAGSALLDEDGGERRTLGEAEKAARRQMMTRAVAALLGDRSADEAVMLRTIVAYEHHRPIDDVAPLHLYSRITAVAGAFDAMTTDRPWRRAMSAVQAIAALQGESGVRFDPLVVATLAHVVASYPVPSFTSAPPPRIAPAAGSNPLIDDLI